MLAVIFLTLLASFSSTVLAKLGIHDAGLALPRGLDDPNSSGMKKVHRSGVKRASSSNADLIPSKTNAAAAALPSGWKLGAQCVSDATAPGRLLEWTDDPAGMTVNICLNECAFHGFKYAATQYGDECWCGNTLNTSGGAGAPLPSESCTAACVGDSSSTCGGTWAVTLYNRTLPASPYTKSTVHAGSSFFSGWNFFTSPDPTGGNVTYVSQSTATSSKLAYVASDGTAIIKVDNTTTLSAGQNRKSVRISTSATYTTALMIFDVLHMPWGCSVWPAIWTVGPDWPNNGEIDIIEGINNITNNQMTFHTGPTTTCNTSVVPSSWTIGHLAETRTARPAPSPMPDAGSSSRMILQWAHMAKASTRMEEAYMRCSWIQPGQRSGDGRIVRSLLISRLGMRRTRLGGVCHPR